MPNFYGSVCDRVREGEEPQSAQSPPFQVVFRVHVRGMFSSAALRLAVDFVESLDSPPTARPKVDKSHTSVVDIVDKVDKEIAREALDLSPLMKEVRLNNALIVITKSHLLQC